MAQIRFKDVRRSSFIMSLLLFAKMRCSRLSHFQKRIWQWIHDLTVWLCHEHTSYVWFERELPDATPSVFSLLVRRHTWLDHSAFYHVNGRKQVGLKLVKNINSNRLLLALSLSLWNLSMMRRRRCWVFSTGRGKVFSKLLKVKCHEGFNIRSQAAASEEMTMTRFWSHWSHLMQHGSLSLSYEFEHGRRCTACLCGSDMTFSFILLIRLTYRGSITV